CGVYHLPVPFVRVFVLWYLRVAELGSVEAILTGFGYGSVMVFSTLDINSVLASRWVTLTVCWRQWCAVNIVLASIDVDVEFDELGVE
ncbi:hypothetical protein Taro_055273, partial [Colocasia esculenta]|nr:hypothetical protein [Colocasia esculenta]